MLLTCASSFATQNHTEIDTLVNGNTRVNTFKNGIITAQSSGSGLFALAVYEDGELISLDVSYSEEELEKRKLNTVIENGTEKKLKIFRFDEDNNPLCVNSDFAFDSSAEVRIYANQDFSNPAEYRTNNNVVVSDGRLEIRASDSSRPRYQISAKNPGRYIVFEADYSIPEGQAQTHRVRLIGGYYASTNGNDDEVTSFVMTTSGGMIYSGKDNKAEKTYGTLSSKPTNIAIMADLEENTYDIYINRERVRQGDSFLPGTLVPGTTYDTRSFYIGHLSGDTESYCNGTLIVDNIKIYEGTGFKNIGNDIPNVHHTDYSEKSTNGASDIYERPEASEIAKKVLNASHPRLLINREKLEKIKTSGDATVIEWRGKILEKAEAALSEEPYKYKINSTQSVENLSDSMERFMNLGLAYLLTGNMEYPDRAYKEAQALYNVYSRIDKDAGDSEENRDYWNSSNCLNVNEISFIISLCYDWMYDAWTQDQKDELYSHVSKNGIDNMYRNYFGMHLPSHTNAEWWKISNNQGAVCNGSAILTGIAFMEEDAYRCSQIVESGVRALEIVLSNFAPDGGWNESTSYWAYTLKTFTMACCTLELVCGTNYGLQDAPGLRNSCYYSLATSGETGAMSFGDGVSSHTNAPFLFYWAKAYKDPKIGGAAMYIKQKFGFEPNVYDLVYYDADYIGEISLDDAFYYSGTEMVSFASGRNNGETYIIMSGGKGHSTGHDHLDSGHIILEMNGERVFHDMGAEYYGASGYFEGMRHLYFRARPEAHNIFVINPYNTKNSDGSVYYGQSKTAFSKVTSYNPETKTATMDLSKAYARDAQNATRTISLDGKKAIIKDIVTLKGTGDIYWNWYVTVKNNELDDTFAAGNIEISGDGKYATITRNDKKYKVCFETEADYTLSVEKADYYVNVDPDPTGTKHSCETSRRLAVQLKGATGTVELTTIVENME